MSLRRLLSFMCLEGMFLLILGLSILILPKLTMLSFSTMVGIAFIVYGVFKFVNSIINKRVFGNFLCEMLLGIYLLVIGILLTLVPRINIYWLIALIGTYLVLETTSSTIFLGQIKKLLNLWNLKFYSIVVIFIAGLFILVKNPNIAFSTVASIIGVCFLIKGNCKLTLAKLNKEFYLENNTETT